MRRGKRPGPGQRHVRRPSQGWEGEGAIFVGARQQNPWVQADGAGSAENKDPLFPAILAILAILALLAVALIAYAMQQGAGHGDIVPPAADPMRGPPGPARRAEGPHRPQEGPLGARGAEDGGEAQKRSKALSGPLSGSEGIGRRSRPSARRSGAPR